MRSNRFLKSPFSYLGITVYFLISIILVGLITTVISQRLISQIQEHNSHLVQGLARFFAHVPETVAPETARLIQDITVGLSFPVIGVDPGGQPQFRIETLPDSGVEIWSKEGNLWRSNRGSQLPYSDETLAILRQRIKSMAHVHPPIPVQRWDETAGELVDDGLLYYGESAYIRKIRWLPWSSLLLISLFFTTGLWLYRHNQRLEQHAVWIGLARETAHQMGTPLSSLWGWIELLKDRADPEILNNVIMDAERLNRIASRFGKIGSQPELGRLNIATVIQTTTGYFQSRLPRFGKKIELQVDLHDEIAEIYGDKDLLTWVFENLIKNSMDAIERDDGRILITTILAGEKLIIRIQDNGRGMTRQQQRRIFQPGYSTKKRGWGLGLSLVRRIVEDYHHGTIMVEKSEVNRGATFRLELPRYS